MKNKTLLHETLWLFGCLIVTIAVNFALLGKSLFEKDIDINLHDTYFIIKNHHFLLGFFIIFSFILFLIKESKRAFNRKIPFFIFLALGFGLVILIFKVDSIVFLLSELEARQITVAKEVAPSEEGIIAAILTPVNCILLIQTIAIAIMLFATYQHTKSRNN
ncbi:hypothetical protein OC25_22285 [Pedobacter kyungheensis]|uniref:Uncharacterized protein n=1 Tax=Pedobacter kyungheensis TaxID=1069985 RepID=A0A0C1DBJ1_9SPHI|nr:hypothetical protein [Pedobacter kyungheensis]KIA91360.1 hypothetical protein OC25_22285 [Pedobacter kyungheensis]